MPKMGDAMTEGKVVRWYKKQGDPLKKGEPVLEIETDKVNLDLEADEDGFLDEITVNEGEMAPVGGRLAMIRTNGEAPPASKAKPVREEKLKAGSKAEKRPAPPARQKGGEKGGERIDERPEKNAAPEQPLRLVKDDKDYKDDKDDKDEPGARQTQAPPSSSDRSMRSSPLARRMAREMGVDLSEIQGSGPSGRIIAADISRASKESPTQSKGRPTSSVAPVPEKKRLERPSPLEQKVIPLTAMRRTIAKRLGESTGPIPHFYLTIEVDVTLLQAARQQLIEIENVKVSVNDFVIRAVALALLHHPNVNASFGAEAITQHGEVHIGIAVATPEGLITPVIRNADSHSLIEIAEQVRTLAEKARNRKLKPDEYQGSTFTISNLGMFGIEEFTAIINPPNSAILAVGAAMMKPVVVNGQVAIRERMKVTMSCDHRVIDGAAAAQYLQTLQQYLEQPLRLFL